MRRGFVVCCVMVLLMLCATLVVAETLLPGDITANPSKYVNTNVTVQGQVSNFAKSGDLNCKFRYSLTYKGSELPVLTNKMVDDGDKVTVSGKLKYDTAENSYYVIEGSTIPLWMLIVGGALVVVLVVVLILIFRSPKQSSVAYEHEVSVRYCDQCGGVLSANGSCPICTSSAVMPQASASFSSGTETIGDSTIGGRKRSETVLVETPAKAMIVLRNGQSGSYNVGSGSTKIGRNSSNDFVLDEETVSGEHAKIIEEDGKFFIQDLGSRNGTFVNGEKVVRQQLNDGDIIKLGKSEMKFVAINEK